MIRVFIVDDHPLLVEGIRSLLLQQTDIEVIGYATAAESCLKQLLSQKVDVILMDIGLPDMSGIDLCAEIKLRHPAVIILAVSSFHEGCYIKKMMNSGANGYIFKDAGCGDLVEGIK